MKVLIVGAGIAGLTLAYWLEQAGTECTVIEKAPDIRTEGYMIDFGGSGWDVANRMGLIADLKARQSIINEIHYRNGDGEITAKIPVTKLYQIADVADKFMTLNRRDIVDVLYSAVKDKVDIQFDTKIESICQSNDCVSVSFADGRHADYDLLVGADGIHSGVRKLAFGQESSFARYLGYQIAIFMIPATQKIDPAYHMYLEPNHQVSIYPYDNGEWMVFVMYHTDETCIPEEGARKAKLEQILANDRYLVPDILEQIREDTYIFYDTVTQIEVPRWSSNRIVLIGDAAHCPTLISGQGASMAMAGAYFLAQELKSTSNFQQAFLAYETRLRPNIETIQKKARNFAPNFVPATQLRITLINWMLRLIDIPPVTKLVGKQFSIKSIINA